jgi:serine/threonine protein kinase
VVLNERVLNDPRPARELNPNLSPQLQEILSRALERDPRHRYSTAAEMAWELEHQELVGVDDDERRPSLRSRLSLNSARLAIYAAIVLVPIVLFVVMLLLARK